MGATVTISWDGDDDCTGSVTTTEADSLHLSVCVCRALTMANAAVSLSSKPHELIEDVAAYLLDEIIEFNEAKRKV